MASLYELTGEYLELMEMMEDPDMDPQLIADTIEGMEGLLDTKADGYCRIIKDLEGKAEKMKAETERLKTRQNTISNNIKKLKESLMSSMIVTNRKTIETDLFRITVKDNAPQVVIDDENEVPDEYKIAQPAKIDKTNLKKFLKGLGDKTVPYAHLQKGQSLLIS